MYVPRNTHTPQKRKLVQRDRATWQKYIYVRSTINLWAKKIKMKIFFLGRAGRWFFFFCLLSFLVAG